MFSAVLFSGLAPNSISPRARSRSPSGTSEQASEGARARGCPSSAVWSLWCVSDSASAARERDLRSERAGSWSDRYSPTGDLLSPSWFPPYSLTVFLAIALSFSAGALFGLSQVHLQSFDVLFSLTGNLRTSEDRVDARLWTEAEMELLIICLSFGILQCNSVGADSIIHIGKEWAVQSLYLLQMIMNAPSRMRTLREVCCWGRREISIVNKHWKCALLIGLNINWADHLWW